MNIKIKRYRCLLYVLMALFLCSAGCKPAQKPSFEAEPVPSSPAQITESDKRIMANSFSEIAKAVPGINDATVVVAGVSALQGEIVNQTCTTATCKLSTESPTKIIVMAGLSLNPKIISDANQRAQAKKTAEQKILSSDNRVTDVLVTTDANMVKKINDIASGLIEGKPVLSYARDATELGKVMKEQLQ